MIFTVSGIASPEFRTLAVLVSSYLIVVGAAYALLIRHCSRSAKGLAIVMLGAQIIAIALSLAVHRDFEYFRFFDLEQEYNFPTALASAQLALVAAVALAVAVAGRQHSNLTRLYYILISLAFFYLALDEYLTWHELIKGWERYIAALGLALAAATALVAYRAPRQSRKWHLCLLAGLALSAVAALLVEQVRFPEYCSPLGFRSSRCWLPVIEESLELLGIWLVLIAVLGPYSQLATKRFIGFGLSMFLAVWVLLHPPTSWPPSSSLLQYLEYRFQRQHVEVEFEASVRLVAYQLAFETDSIDIALVTSPNAWRDYNELGYALHLVDQASGESLASLDLAARRKPAVKFTGKLLYEMQMTLPLPAQPQTNRAVWLVLTLVKRAGQDYMGQRVISSDLPLLDDSQIILSEFVMRAEPPKSDWDTLAEFNGKISLGAVELPASARAGETLTIAFDWRAQAAPAEDYVQFFHARHAESGEWWVYDQQPLGRRMPTKLWYRGMVDSEAWMIPAPAELKPGSYDVYTGLYRASDSQRLPVTDSDGKAFTDALVPLGSLMVKAA